MLGLGTLTKLARGSMSLEELGGMLQAAGIALTMTPVEGGQAVRTEFAGLAADAAKGGAKLLRIQGQMKNGDRIHALLIMNS